VLRIEKWIGQERLILLLLNFRVVEKKQVRCSFTCQHADRCSIYSSRG
jgi:hypothetical protein